MRIRNTDFNDNKYASPACKATIAKFYGFLKHKCNTKPKIYVIQQFYKSYF